METQQRPTVWYIETQATDSGWGLVTYYRRSWYYAIKRLLDIIVSTTALLLLVPVMLLIAVLVRLDTPGPAIFKQERVTAKRKASPIGETWEISIFTCYKFRSMYNDTTPELHRAFFKAFIESDQEEMAQLNGEDTDLCKLVNDPRISRIGRFIRRTSLDELPQLWNVLKGEMSIVGPRPAIAYEVEMYSSWHRRRLAAKPGLTGWWQIHGRGSADFDDSVRLDVWYVEHQSLWLDIVILLKTPYAVLSGRGAA
jgi:lipopolysaccharide/colanic/teichoic acid biosynthesis glycosyltransferase